MSVLLVGTEEHHSKIREIASKYVTFQQKEGRFRMAPSSHGRLGAWCGEEHVVAVSEITGAPFWVTEVDEVKCTDEATITRQRVSGSPLLVMRYGNHHYEVMRKPGQVPFYVEEKPKSTECRVETILDMWHEWLMSLGAIEKSVRVVIDIE